MSRAEPAARLKSPLTTAEQAFAMLTGLPASTEVTLPSPQPRPAGERRGRAQVKPSPSAPTFRWQSSRPRPPSSRSGRAMGWLPDVSARHLQPRQNLGFQGEPDWWMVVLNATWTPWDGGYRITTQRDAASNARAAQLMQEKALLGGRARDPRGLERL
ncbi:MAG: hypothetical protein IPI35_32230 [Deltaproteobacteria bacterium]|nr:hypothetical protein [Deltaproteobacteria bacterium]